MKNAISWKVLSATPIMLLLVLTFVSTAWAGGSDTKHRIAIQISTEDEGIRNLTLLNAKLLQEAYGADNVHIVIVAFGPGLSVLTKKSPQAEQIAALTSNNIEVNACAITMKMMGEPPLVTGVEVVPNGVVRMIELQEHDYALFLL